MIPRVALGEIPPGYSEDYTLVEFTAFGRSANAKRALHRAIVRNLGEEGVAADELIVVLDEHALENWGSGAADLPSTSIAAFDWTSDRQAPGDGTERLLRRGGAQ